MESFIITKDIYDKVVPKEMLPQALDSMFGLYICVQMKEEEGVLLYDMKTSTSSFLSPYFEPHFKFSLPYFVLEDSDITYQDLIVAYEKKYHLIYEKQRGNDIERRKKILAHNYQELYQLHELEIIDSEEVIYELRFDSKSGIWVLFRIENYIVKYVDDPRRLLRQEQYGQSFVPLQHLDLTDGIPLATTTAFLLQSPSFLNRLRKYKIPVL